MDATQATVFPSEFGWIGLAVRDQAVCELTFGHTSAAECLQALVSRPALAEKSTRFLRDVQRRLEAFCRRPQDDFLDIQLDLGRRTEFQQAVVDRCRRIPVGETISYAELARRAGRPLAARAVGQVMATNRLPLIIPCHRVVGANGTLGGYSARDGLVMKRRLLEFEGVEL